MSEAIKMYQKEHKDILVGHLNVLRENGQLLDVSIESQGQRIDAHAVVLTAFSSYFDSILKERDSDPSDKVSHICLDGSNVSFHSVKTWVDFMYTGKIEVCDVSKQELWLTAQELNIKKGIELLQNVTIDSLQGIGSSQIYTDDDTDVDDSHEEKDEAENSPEHKESKKSSAMETTDGVLRTPLPDLEIKVECLENEDDEDQEIEEEAEDFGMQSLESLNDKIVMFLYIKPINGEYLTSPDFEPYKTPYGKYLCPICCDKDKTFTIKALKKHRNLHKQGKTKDEIQKIEADIDRKRRESIQALSEDSSGIDSAEEADKESDEDNIGNKIPKEEVKEGNEATKGSAALTANDKLVVKYIRLKPSNGDYFTSRDFKAFKNVKGKFKCPLCGKKSKQFNFREFKSHRVFHRQRHWEMGEGVKRSTNSERDRLVKHNKKRSYVESDVDDDDVDDEYDNDNLNQVSAVKETSSDVPKPKKLKVEIVEEEEYEDEMNVLDEADEEFSDNEKEDPDYIGDIEGDAADPAGDMEAEPSEQRTINDARSQKFLDMRPKNGEYFTSSDFRPYKNLHGKYRCPICRSISKSYCLKAMKRHRNLHRQGNTTAQILKIENERKKSFLRFEDIVDSESNGEDANEEGATKEEKRSVVLSKSDIFDRFVHLKPRNGEFVTSKDFKRYRTDNGRFKCPICGDQSKLFDFRGFKKHRSLHKRGKKIPDIEPGAKSPDKDEIEDDDEDDSNLCSDSLEERTRKFLKLSPSNGEYWMATDFEPYKNKYGRYKCPICGIKSKSFNVKGFKRHRSLHKQSNTCINNQLDTIQYDKTAKEIKIHCNECEYETIDNTEFLTHRKIHTDERVALVNKTRGSDGVYRCLECAYESGKRKGMLVHQKLHRKEKPFSCKNCDRKFVERTALMEHTRVHTGERPFVCKVCKKSYRLRQNLRHHIISTHQEKDQRKIYLCDKCSCTYVNARGLQKHMAAAHMKERPFPCDFEGCSYRAPDKSTLKEHKKTHLPNREPILCETCGRSFKNKQNLKNHIKTHQEKDISCPHAGCDFMTQFKYNLKGHLMRVHGEDQKGNPVQKRHFCQQCNYAAFSSSKFKEHILRHEREEFQKCPICAYTATNKEHMVKHMKTHTGDTPYYCHECKKGFTGPSGLARHKQSHLGLKPFGCMICDKRYAGKNGLKVHMFTHENRKPYVCNVCSFGCVRKSTILKHIAVEHGSDSIPDHLMARRKYNMDGFSHKIHDLSSTEQSSQEEVPVSDIRVPTSLAPEGLHTYHPNMHQEPMMPPPPTQPPPLPPPHHHHNHHHHNHLQNDLMNFPFHPAHQPAPHLWNRP